jgi:serine O-acetyltransferase
VFGTLLRAITTVGYVFVRNVYGIELPPQTLIGRRVKISHQSGIVVSGDAVIGDGCRLRQNVTIGSRGRIDPVSGRRKPVLESDVYVGAGATILGGITIGAGARIGANALVLTDVPPGARVYAPVATIASRTTEPVTTADP